LEVCEQPVEEALAVPLMDSPGRTSAIPCAGLSKQASRGFADMAGQLIDQKGAREFQEKLEEEIEHGPRRMALIGQLEKTGKASLRPNRTSVQLFPPFQHPPHILC
jgi:hypothetical protein